MTIKKENGCKVLVLLNLTLEDLTNEDPKENFKYHRCSAISE
jgi:hypothetical protein